MLWALRRNILQQCEDVDEQLVNGHGEDIQSLRSQTHLNLHSSLCSRLCLAQIKALGLHLMSTPAHSLSGILYSSCRWASRGVYRDETYFQWHKILIFFFVLFKLFQLCVEIFMSLSAWQSTTISVNSEVAQHCQGKPECNQAGLLFYPYMVCLTQVTCQ